MALKTRLCLNLQIGILGRRTHEHRERDYCMQSTVNLYDSRANPECVESKKKKNVYLINSNRRAGAVVFKLIVTETFFVGKQQYFEKK